MSCSEGIFKILPSFDRRLHTGAQCKHLIFFSFILFVAYLFLCCYYLLIRKRLEIIAMMSRTHSYLLRLMSHFWKIFEGEITCGSLPRRFISTFTINSVESWILTDWTIVILLLFSISKCNCSFEISSANLNFIRYTTISPSQPFLQHLHWHRVRQRIDYKLAILTYKIHHTSTPVYLSRHIQPLIVTRRLRSSAVPRVCKPTTRTNFADRAFRCSAPAV